MTGHAVFGHAALGEAVLHCRECGGRRAISTYESRWPDRLEAFLDAHRRCGALPPGAAP